MKKIGIGLAVSILLIVMVIFGGTAFQAALLQRQIHSLPTHLAKQTDHSIQCQIISYHKDLFHSTMRLAFSYHPKNDEENNHPAQQALHQHPLILNLDTQTAIWNLGSIATGTAFFQNDRKHVLPISIRLSWIGNLSATIASKQIQPDKLVINTNLNFNKFGIPLLKIAHFAHNQPSLFEINNFTLHYQFTRNNQHRPTFQLTAKMGKLTFHDSKNTVVIHHSNLTDFAYKAKNIWYPSIKLSTTKISQNSITIHDIKASNYTKQNPSYIYSNKQFSTGNVTNNKFILVKSVLAKASFSHVNPQAFFQYQQLFLKPFSSLTSLVSTFDDNHQLKQWMVELYTASIQIMESQQLKYLLQVTTPQGPAQFNATVQFPASFSSLAPLANAQTFLRQLYKQSTVSGNIHITKPLVDALATALPQLNLSTLVEKLLATQILLKKENSYISHFHYQPNGQLIVNGTILIPGRLSTTAPTHK